MIQLDAARGGSGHRWPQFLPDGRHFVYFSRTPGGSESDKGVYFSSLDGEKPRLVARSGAGATLVRPDRLLLLADATLLSYRFDTATGTVSGDRVVIARERGRVQQFLRGGRGLARRDNRVRTRGDDLRSPVDETRWHGRSNSRQPWPICRLPLVSQGWDAGGGRSRPRQQPCGHLLPRSDARGRPHQSHRVLAFDGRVAGVVPGRQPTGIPLEPAQRPRLVHRSSHRRRSRVAFPDVRLWQVPDELVGGRDNRVSHDAAG